MSLRRRSKPDYHARDVLDGLASSQPYNVDLGLTLSLLHLKIGDLMRDSGDLGEANEAYRSSLTIAERLAVSQPGNEDLQRNQAEALAALSTVSGASEFGSKLDCAKNHQRASQLSVGISLGDGWSGCSASPSCGS